MKTALTIAAEEWRYWIRSKLALAVIALFAVMLVSVSWVTVLRMQAASAELDHHQAEAEETFVAQPDRNPHRMVHYGHYVFRSPVPLASFDPGLDSVTGQAMFLEGHRQNSATFSASAASGDPGGLSWLTPALTYQVFAPLLLILLGHSAVVREREARVLPSLLAQGVSGRSLMAGKILALLVFILLLLVPLGVIALLAVTTGESLMAAAALVGVYFLYLSVWGGITVLLSSAFSKRSSVIAALAAFWLMVTLVLPSIAVNVASVTAPLAGKIEMELAMLTEQKDLSDGHSVSNSQVEQLSAELFQQYGVNRLEDLEINIRGLLAQKAEEKLTLAMNAYADKRMASELRQTELLTAQGWLTPMIAVAAASRAISGTDMQHYHRFLRQAEELRYDFVQDINQVHAEQLSYVDDINRNRDEESYNRSRVDAANWQLLDEFRFDTASASSRLASAGTPIGMLLFWLAVLFALLTWTGGRLKP
ncbi:MAG: DUF3526 domain-containing protein [Xanthomonadales bacterium]|nr:DUF3526 domain-containing protein [Xanthomonadales bacterium]